ncbi:MAG: hypothetical protein JWQ72_1369 [Polaromonas sp.]|nr:hypothetical protein [Polaromonas sp.]
MAFGRPVETGQLLKKAAPQADGYRPRLLQRCQPFVCYLLLPEPLDPPELPEPPEPLPDDDPLDPEPLPLMPELPEPEPPDMPPEDPEPDPPDPDEEPLLPEPLLPLPDPPLPEPPLELPIPPEDEPEAPDEEPLPLVLPPPDPELLPDLDEDAAERGVWDWATRSCWLEAPWPLALLLDEALLLAEALVSLDESGPAACAAMAAHAMQAAKAIGWMMFLTGISCVVEV